jgi:hypothetical protein
MKHVGNSRFVIECWAKQRPEDARTPTRNLTYSHPVLTSYSTDIAKVFTNGDGKRLAVVDATNHSSTTRKQQWAARKACARAGLDYVYESFECRRGYYFSLHTPEEMIKILTGTYLAATSLANKSRSEWYRERRSNNADSILASMDKLAKFFGVKRPSREELCELENQEDEKRLEKKREHLKAIKDWKAGRLHAAPYGFKGIRLSGDLIENHMSDAESVGICRTVVLQWMTDRVMRQPWSFISQIRNGTVFGKMTYKTRIDLPVSDERCAAVDLFIGSVGIEGAIRFFEKNNLLLPEESTVEPTALTVNQ